MSTYLDDSLFLGIIAGIVSGAILWLFSQLFNIGAKKTLQIQSKRMQYYLVSINNDITWGTEDKIDDYYAILTQKIPFVLHAVDLAKDSIALLDFRLTTRRCIIKQLDEIQKGIEDLLEIVVGADRESEKLKRLEAMRKYQTEASNILLIRAEFIEKLACSISVNRALSKMSYDDENVDEIEKILLDY